MVLKGLALTLLAIFAGIQIGRGNPNGFPLAALAVLMLGMVMSAAQRQGAEAGTGLTFDRPMTGQDLWTILRPMDDLHERRVFIAGPGIRPAKGIFLARLHGERALVIEGADMEKSDGEV